MTEIKTIAGYPIAGGGSLSIASADTLGGVKIGNNLDITEDGVLSVIGEWEDYSKNITATSGTVYTCVVNHIAKTVYFDVVFSCGGSSNNTQGYHYSASPYLYLKGFPKPIGGSTVLIASNFYNDVYFVSGSVSLGNDGSMSCHSIYNHFSATSQVYCRLRGSYPYSSL